MSGKPIAPGGTVGILGGGQLGRMLASAAAEMGLHTHIYCPDENAPAAEVAAQYTRAEYEDEAALTRFAESVDAVTYEFENVPAETARILSAHGIVRPGPLALATAQDRIVEKNFMQANGILTAPFADITDEASLRNAVENIGTPSVLKTRRFGYDGKGQAKIMAPEDAIAAWDEIGRAPAILEGFVSFEREISVIVARGENGETAAYDPVENIHKNHILDRTLAPAALPEAVAGEACAIAARIAAELDYVGVMGVEMFLLPEAGAEQRLLVNEIAPRVHNSGHWTMDACAVGQFEQHMRAVCGWPLGHPQRHSDAVMTNLIGDEADGWKKLAAEPGTAIHLYGKAEARPGRKMGHATKLYPLGKRPPVTSS
ncbi:5-(carboxyamino)imidazole ribonucleotide synthase [Parvibaculum sp.]|uniref:5-(carboxyamino)imidazole ribonucleotide synthase n=1 Tax=Parvibaculum sp. TaxID=2024848 RepID=UPI000C62FD87|nr:5-(carboxyamino)imidazole ribonucleotide synthase [Parvibaculum sp.]MAM94737.1 5-(carboxyamino)imidazole ribonucleotide synthase [Parvibaculum sp.]HCX67240.1 5-(carboxyamino)imidazole ribonucleotide synthase [Rhodobiaceae bacterium]